MEISIELVVLIILLIDSIGANIVSWFGGEKWFAKHFRIFSRYFPVTKGWTTYYFILVVWMGIMMFRSGLLVF